MNEPTPTPTAPAGPTAPTVTPHVEPHTKAGVSESEAAQMMGWLKQDLAQGRISPEQAQKAFDQLQATEEQRGPDQRTDAQREIDAALGPPAKAHEFVIPWHAVGDPTPLSPEMKQLDASARAWLSGAQFDRTLGNSLVSSIEKVVQRTAKMTETQLEQYGYDEFAKLEKVHGDKLDERLRQAGRMVEDLEKTRSGLKQFLKTRGVGDSAMVANLLIGQAERYWARRR